VTATLAIVIGVWVGVLAATNGGQPSGTVQGVLLPQMPPPGKIVIGVAGGTIAMVQAVQGRQLVATDSSSLGPTSVLASPLRSPLSCRQGDIC
jgi:hypothetical protein